MFSFKTTNKIKSNYKGVAYNYMYLCLSKGFSTLVKTSFANLISSVITAASKPLIMESLCSLRWFNMFQIHLP